MKSVFIDIGSTFIKYRIKNGTEIIADDKEPFPKPAVNDGERFEVDGMQIAENVQKTVNVAKENGCERIYISVQMHGYVLKKKDGGFTNYISWRDKRGVVDGERAKINLKKNGTAVKKNLPLIKLMDTELDGIDEFFTLGSFIAYILTGNNVTHITDCAASGLYDINTLCPTFDFNIKLPKAVKSLEPIGSFEDMICFPPCGDHQISFLGSGANYDGYLLNIGTATQISTLSDEINDDIKVESRPYFTSAYLDTVSGLVGGDKLYQGYDQTEFCEEVSRALDLLPKKNKILVGGGGGDTVFDAVCGYFEKKGIKCEKIKTNIGMKGMEELEKMTETKIGTMLSEVKFANFPIMLKNKGFDFIIIDNEHGAFEWDFIASITTIARLVGMELIVRLPDNSRANINRYADMGVQGFLLPMTNTPDDVKKVVDYAKYTPIGKRGVSTNRLHTFYNPPPLSEYMKTANGKMKVYAQIETLEGLKNIDGILETTGVDGLFIGPNDLSIDMDCVGDVEPVKKAITTVSEAVKKHGSVYGIITTNGSLIEHCKSCGIDMICYGSELNMLKDSCSNIINKFKN